MEKFLRVICNKSKSEVCIGDYRVIHAKHKEFHKYYSKYTVKFMKIIVINIGRTVYFQVLLRSILARWNHLSYD